MLCYFSFRFGLPLLSYLVLSESSYDFIFLLIYHINYNSYFKHLFIHLRQGFLCVMAQAVLELAP